MPTGIYKRKPHTEETKRKISLANLGKKCLSDRCLVCGQIRNRIKHNCPISVWNKGTVGIMKAWNKNLKGYGSFNKGKKRSEEVKQKISLSKKGIQSWSKGIKGDEFKKHYPNGMKGCFTVGKSSGIKNINWKGGITPINFKIRNSLSYKLWRKAVFERDNFCCQKTGDKGGQLVAHHINNFSNFPELRTSIENGITLSKKSHVAFHKKYGNRNNTKEQLIEFLINS